jgi:hypothetical protein
VAAAARADLRAPGVRVGRCEGCGLEVLVVADSRGDPMVLDPAEVDCPRRPCPRCEPGSPRARCPSCGGAGEVGERVPRIGAVAVGEDGQARRWAVPSSGKRRPGEALYMRHRCAARPPD